MINHQKQLHFAIISCGGTISMEPNKQGVLEPKKTIDEIITDINVNSLSDKIIIDPDKRIELLKLDSADLNPNHWQKIITAIEEVQNRCDGILIFHGTDTMSYSATAVGLALSQKITIPVIFTGAQAPLNESGNDGKTNIERSLLVLEQAARDGAAECMIFFGDKAYRAVNSRKRSEADFNAFESPSVSPLYVTGGLGVQKIWPARKAIDVDHAKKRIGIPLRNSFAKGVVVLSIIPGLESRILMAVAQNNTTQAIILNSLGAGNIPALQGDYNLIPSILEITHTLKKPVIIASPFVGGSTHMEVYLPGILAKEAGAINAGKMTAEATVVKTRLLLAQPELSHSLDALKKSLAIDFAGETANVDNY